MNMHTFYRQLSMKQVDENQRRLARWEAGGRCYSSVGIGEMFVRDDDASQDNMHDAIRSLVNPAPLVSLLDEVIAPVNELLKVT